MDDLAPEKEEWRPIQDHPRYEISSFGRVRTVTTATKWAGHIHGHRSRRDNKGYPQTQLSLGDSKRVTVKIHRLVAEAFLGPRPAGLLVNHLDGDKTNCRADNLHYVTAEQNYHHAICIGRAVPLDGTNRHHPRKLNVNDISDIRRLAREGVPQSQIASQFGVHQVTVSEIVTRKIWNHIP